MGQYALDKIRLFLDFWGHVEKPNAIRESQIENLTYLLLGLFLLAVVPYAPGDC